MNAREKTVLEIKGDRHRFQKIGASPLLSSPLLSRRRGLSLVEAVLAVALTAVLILMSLSSMGSIAKGRQVANQAYQGTMLAEQLMTEICQNAYSDPQGGTTFGPETSDITNPATRNLFDDVDDYNNWSETPPRNKDGTTVANFTGWTRTVAVAYIDPATMAVSATDKGTKRVTVTVADPRGNQTTLVGLRSTGGQYDVKPSATTTCVRWVGVTLQVGSDARYTVNSGTGVPNFVP
jgi:MSHA pilin protein MshD